MKKYIIFIYEQHHELGGFNDYLNRFDTLEESKEYIIEYYKKYEYSNAVNFQIVNLEKFKKLEYYFCNHNLYLDDEDWEEVKSEHLCSDNV